MPPLKPQDLVVLLRLAAGMPGVHTSRAVIARECGISAGELSKSLDRSAGAHLFDSSRGAIRSGELAEFVRHGVRYAFPVERGPVGRGVPTSIAASPLRERFAGAGESPLRSPVWPHVDGTVLGYAIAPLYPTVPDVAPQTLPFYELLALVDALREGRARERAMAADLLATRLAP